MHIEIQNCFSFWGTSVPRPHAQDVPHILYQVYAPCRSVASLLMNSVGGNLAAENTIRLRSEMIFYCRSEAIRLRLTDCRRGRYDTVARCYCLFAWLVALFVFVFRRKWRFTRISSSQPLPWRFRCGNCVISNR